MTTQNYDLSIWSESDWKRFWNRILIKEGCWVWLGGIRNGYGSFWISNRGSRKRYKPHRVLYQILIGLVPPDLELDHVESWGCVSRSCCRPDHLEAVTHAENVQRSSNHHGSKHNLRKTHCPR